MLARNVDDLSWAPLWRPYIINQGSFFEMCLHFSIGDLTNRPGLYRIQFACLLLPSQSRRSAMHKASTGQNASGRGCFTPVIPEMGLQLRIRSSHCGGTPFLP